MRPRRPWGLRNAKLSPLSLASGWLGGVTISADQNETSPSLVAANSGTVATFVGSRGPGGVTSYAIQNEAWPPLGAAKLLPFSLAPGTDQNETSPSLGGCELRNSRHFRGLLGGPAEVRLTRITTIARGAWGAAICAAVATFVGSWEAQRKYAYADHMRPPCPLGGLRSAQLSPLL